MRQPKTCNGLIRHILGIEHDTLTFGRPLTNQPSSSADGTWREFGLTGETSFAKTVRLRRPSLEVVLQKRSGRRIAANSVTVLGRLSNKTIINARKFCQPVVKRFLLYFGPIRMPNLVRRELASTDRCLGYS